MYHIVYFIAKLGDNRGDKIGQDGEISVSSAGPSIRLCAYAKLRILTLLLHQPLPHLWVLFH